MANAVELVIKAKNMVATGLNKAKAQLQAFGQSAAKIGRSVAGAFKIIGAAVAAASAAIIGIAATTIKAYAEQERAEKSLAAALRARGESVEATLPKMKQLAAAIQDETGLADENTLAIMANMTQLGLSSKNIEQATKMHIALTNAGMGTDTALRAVVAALEAGDTSMLTRYIPSMRSAKTEQEKLTIVNNLASEGYQKQREELDTTSGRYKELQGRIGDFKEEIGKAITKSSGMSSILATLSDKIKAAGIAFSKWAEGGGIERVIAMFKTFGIDAKRNVLNVATVFSTAWKAISANTEWLAGVVITHFTNQGRAIQTIFTNVKDNVSALFGAIWEKIKNPGGEFVMPDMTPILEGFQKMEAAPNEWKNVINEGLKEVEDRNKEAEENISKVWADYDSQMDENARNAAEREKKLADEKIKASEEAAKVQTENAYEVAEVEKTALKDVVKELENFGNMTESKADQFVRAVLALSNGLKDVNFKGKLGELTELSKVSLPRNITESKAQQVIRALTALAKGLGGINFQGNLGELTKLGDVKIPKLTRNQALSFVAALNEISKFKGKIPDIGKGLNIPDDMALQSLKDMANALAKADGAKLEVTWEQNAMKDLTTIADNTGRTANKIEQLLVLK